MERFKIIQAERRVNSLTQLGVHIGCCSASGAYGFLFLVLSFSFLSCIPFSLYLYFLPLFPDLSPFLLCFFSFFLFFAG